MKKKSELQIEQCTGWRLFSPSKERCRVKAIIPTQINTHIFICVKCGIFRCINHIKIHPTGHYCFPSCSFFYLKINTQLEFDFKK